MKKVFISGSRQLWRLNSDVKARLDNYISDGVSILIGDANGSDKAIQKYFKEKAYNNVVVYCMKNDCRNNVGDWPVTYAVSPKKKKDANYYGIKDKLMAAEADSGFVLWDGESKGAFRNILSLIVADKPVDVFYQPADRIYEISSRSGFDGFIAEYKVSDNEDLKIILAELYCRFPPEENRSGPSQFSLFE